MKESEITLCSIFVIVFLLNEKIIMTGSNVVCRGRLKELDREDARKRPGGIVLRMTWKV